ncbi:hypothetical protein RJ639_008462 [Escallonia herrerae]|uniref:Uncharacterized protein n=1 Tax=Escallonia herrerae TaxID=1293975 RepID=A0AA88VU72_9ASTE|nr:hypothetical protein RJ639_008462 [Escallonia herrerae]
MVREDERLYISVVSPTSLSLSRSSFHTSGSTSYSAKGLAMAAETKYAHNLNQAMVREDERLLSEGEVHIDIVSVGEIINADSQSQGQNQNILRIYNEPLCGCEVPVVVQERMSSSAPSKENGKKNEDPESKRDRLLGSVQQMIKLDTARHAAPKGSVQLPAPCIFEVPDKLRKLKASAYTPRAVSLGPLHKDDKHLQRRGMEGHKKRYMLSLFLRSMSTDEAVEAGIAKTEAMCVDAMLEMVDKARACYDASHGLCEDDDVKFAEMLILDGCFLLELFYKRKEEEEVGVDPVFSNQLLQLDIIHDLVLLENQIPFSVLEKLFECTLKRIKGNPSSLTDLVLNFFEKLHLFGDIKVKKEVTPTSNRHVLGLLHSYYRPSSAQQENTKENELIIKHTATELDRAGVKFVIGVGKDYLDLKFNTSCWFDWLCGSYCVYDSSRSRLCCCFSWFCQIFGRSRFGIPKLCIFDDTETLLRNLIAFEQCCPDIEQRHITSYAFFMDTLIDSIKDIHLLETAGVIVNNSGSSEDASDLFNNLCKEIAMTNFFFFSQWKQVDDYYNSPWPRSLALLRRNYFSNPWSGISVIAALILFALIVIQTVYSVRSSP